MARSAVETDPSPAARDLDVEEAVIFQPRANACQIRGVDTKAIAELPGS